MFEEGAIPGKGLGIRAVIDIPKGTPILAEEAFFSVLNSTVPNQYKRRKAFSDLFCTEPRTAQKRFDANSFEMDGPARGIFLKASRFNHSCRPNAYFMWNPKRQRLTVNALFNISDGEEISVNYLPLEFAKTRRQHHDDLADYDFVCDCPSCDQTTDFGRASEIRRDLMGTLEPEFDEVGTASESRLLNLNRFIHLLQEEGLVYPQLADAYRSRASWYRMKMNSPTTEGETNVEYRRFCRDSALQAARSALDLDIVANGHDSPIVDSTVEFIREIGRE